jgi:hypothetical protein
MKIAVIGWGSLIWCPGALRIQTAWHNDGPSLPIEFARISKDYRLTLVIRPRSAHQRTYWAVSAFDDLGRARTNLREREGCRDDGAIHYVTSDAQACGQRQIVDKVKRWLRAKENIDAAIWTGLDSNWKKKRAKPFSAADAVDYLDCLRARDETSFERAKEYVRNAPPQIQTAVRQLLKRRSRDWSDNDLAEVLFVR